jgi:hypothetical protein
MWSSRFVLVGSGSGMSGSTTPKLRGGNLTRPARPEARGRRDDEPYAKRGCARCELLLSWFPNVEPFELPSATHLLHVENPSGDGRSLPREADEATTVPRRVGDGAQRVALTVPSKECLLSRNFQGSRPGLRTRRIGAPPNTPRECPAPFGVPAAGEKADDRVAVPKASDCGAFAHPRSQRIQDTIQPTRTRVSSHQHRYTVRPLTCVGRHAALVRGRSGSSRT